MRIKLIAALTLVLLMSCSKSHIEITPSSVLVDSDKQTVELKTSREIRMIEVRAGIVADQSMPYYSTPIEKDYYEDEGKLSVSRHIIGDWCHIEGNMFTDVILIHLDENNDSESRGIAIEVYSGDDFARAHIIQEGKQSIQDK